MTALWERRILGIFATASSGAVSLPGTALVTLHTLRYRSIWVCTWRVVSHTLLYLGVHELWLVLCAETIIVCGLEVGSQRLALTQWKHIWIWSTTESLWGLLWDDCGRVLRGIRHVHVYVAQTLVHMVREVLFAAFWGVLLKIHLGLNRDLFNDSESFISNLICF